MTRRGARTPRDKILLRFTFGTLQCHSSVAFGAPRPQMASHTAKRTRGSTRPCDTTHACTHGVTITVDACVQGTNDGWMQATATSHSSSRRLCELLVDSSCTCACVTSTAHEGEAEGASQSHHDDRAPDQSVHPTTCTDLQRHAVYGFVHSGTTVPRASLPDPSGSRVHNRSASSTSTIAYRREGSE
jgi:hypothetical protein